MVNENILIGKATIPQDNQIGPGKEGLPKGPPPGFFALKQTTTDVARVAQSLLKYDFGTMIPFSVNGKEYMARLEPHYHPPGFKGGPSGWHKGVTVYEKSSGSKLTNKTEKNQDLYNKIDTFLSQFDDI